MTAQITTLPGGTAQAAASGTVIRVEPGVRYEIADIAPDGTVGPALTAAQLTMAPNVPDFGDMSVTLPDGTVLVFKGMVELFALGAGLSVGGDQVVASLEDLTAPAAGGETGAGPDGGGSSQAFNLASPGSPNVFGDAPEGRFDPADSDIAPPDGEDPNDFVEAADPAPGEDPDPGDPDPVDPGPGPDPKFGLLFTSGADVANFNRGVPAFLPDGTPNPQFARLSGSSGNVDPADRNVTRAGAGDDLVRLDDKDGDNNLNKLFGKPTAFDGGAGNDRVFGGSDDDRILGGADDDILLGAGGDDTLDGGDGKDLAVGGTGADLGIWRSDPDMELPPEISIFNSPSGGNGVTPVKDGDFFIGARDFYHGNGLDVTKDGGKDAVRGVKIDAGDDGPNETQDTLRLVLTEKQFGNTRIVKDDLQGFIRHLAGAGKDTELYKFNHLELSASEWEKVEFAMQGFEDLVLTNLIVGARTDSVTVGTDANDLFIGTRDTSVFTGDYKGRDRFAGKAGDDLALGFSGDDTLIGDHDGTPTGAFGDDKLFGGDGNDTLGGDAGGAITSGGVGGNDALHGGGGKDVLTGDAHGKIGGGSRGGDDSLYGGDGNDILSGDAGGEIDGGGRGGDDVVFGGGGNDLITGDAGARSRSDASNDNDDIEGAGSRGGNDTLFGGSGDDDIFGDALDDVTGGGVAGNDDLYGGDGDDFLVGDAGGGRGTVLALDSAGDDKLYGGKGSDVLLGDSGAGTGGESSIREDLKKKDAKALAAHRDRENGTGGDDTLDGGGGDDAVFGGAGSDLAIFTGGESDFDYYDGGGGKEGTDRDGSRDTLRLLLTPEQLANQSVIDELRDFLAHIKGTGAGKGDDAVFKFKTLKLSAVEFEALQLGLAGFPDRHVDATDLIAGTGDGPAVGTGANNLFMGTDGPDSFIGEAGDDLALGAEGMDSLVGDYVGDPTGDFGDDTLVGGAGQDILTGDLAGNDMLKDSKGGDDTLRGGDGDDQIFGDGSNSMRNGAVGGNDRIFGGRGRDKISGDAAGDLRDGAKGGDDIIHGDGDRPLEKEKSESFSVSPNARIPSEGNGGADWRVKANLTSSTLKISGFEGKISDLNLKLNLTHSWPGSLSITLIAPDGTEIVLADIRDNSNAPNREVYSNVTFDDDGGGVPVGTAVNRETTLRPLNPLSAFDGKDPNGTWTLRIHDSSPSRTGTLRSWGLDIKTPVSFDDNLVGDAGGAIVDSVGGADKLYGGEGNDFISGDAGGDIEAGGSGGNDTLFGGDGNDTLVGDAGGVIKGTGSKGGDDVLYGGDGDDTLYGDAANKKSAQTGIEAGASGGDDTLEGGAGDDTLYGDAPGSIAGTGGKDTFLFNLGQATGDDVIKDYDLDDDTLRFDDVLGAKGSDDDKIAALEKIVDVKEDGADVVITRTDAKGGTIRIEGIAGSGAFDSVQDLADATTLEINA